MTETKTMLQAWVDKLRSGDIPQGRGQLRKDDGSMCCLGVLASIHPDATYVPETKFEDGNEYRWDEYADDGQHFISSTDVPWQVLSEILKLNIDDAQEVGEQLMLVNDDVETGTFTEIATMIEQVAKGGPHVSCLWEGAL